MYKRHLKVHYSIVIALYVIVIIAAWNILVLVEVRKSQVTLLSAGAIFATFGSAISSIGLIWQDDLFERVRSNIDILYRDILKQENP